MTGVGSSPHQVSRDPGVGRYLELEVVIAGGGGRFFKIEVVVHIRVDRCGVRM